MSGGLKTDFCVFDDFVQLKATMAATVATIAAVNWLTVPEFVTLGFNISKYSKNS